MTADQSAIYSKAVYFDMTSARLLLPRNWNRCFLIGVAVFLVLSAFASSLSAQETADADYLDRVYRITDNLRCPTCQGLAVADSQSEISENMKAKVLELIKEGKSDQEIYDFFEQRYGEWILRTPRPTGSNLIIWLLPGAFLLVIIGSIGWYLIRKDRLAAKPTVNQAAGSEAVVDKTIEEKLRNLRRNI